jgi:phthalate 4,5-dioxygenase oxygenase subunit
MDVNAQDQWAMESQGPIHDRTREHLGQSDKAIAAYRSLLHRSIEQAERGETPLMVIDAATAKDIRGPIALDAIGPTQGLEEHCKEIDAKRRAASDWAATAPAPKADGMARRGVSDEAAV